LPVFVLLCIHKLYFLINVLKHSAALVFRCEHFHVYSAAFKHFTSQCEKKIGNPVGGLTAENMSESCSWSSWTFYILSKEYLSYNSVRSLLKIFFNNFMNPLFSNHPQRYTTTRALILIHRINLFFIFLHN